MYIHLFFIYCTCDYVYIYIYVCVYVCTCVWWWLIMFSSKATIWGIYWRATEKPSLPLSISWSMRLGREGSLCADVCCDATRCDKKNMEQWMITPTMQCARLQDVGGKPAENYGNHFLYSWRIRHWTQLYNAEKWWLLFS